MKEGEYFSTENSINKYYISGKFALNMRRDDDITFGDWHGGIWDDISTYPDNRITHFGELGKLNTNMIWGDYGIYDGKNILLRRKSIKTELDKIYIADHIRAVLDLLYFYLINFEKIWEVGEAARNYILDIDKINEMLFYSKKIKGFLDKKLLKEYKNWYINQKKVLKEI